MRKLNRKGFTLIELLAVIVILAVVMGIAITSVLGSMNKARGGATFDTAQIVANGFLNRYTEALVGGSPSAIFSAEGVSSYGFAESATYYISEDIADIFSISGKTYKLAAKGSTISKLADGTKMVYSFITYNSGTGKFTACMIIPSDSSNYVDAYKLKAPEGTSEVAISSFGDSENNITGVNGSNSDIDNYKVDVGTMMSCSDGTQTWNK